MRRGRASPAKQGERQEYIDVLSLHRQSLQNKQCFHNLYVYLSAARNRFNPVKDRKMQQERISVELKMVLWKGNRIDLETNMSLRQGSDFLRLIAFWIRDHCIMRMYGVPVLLLGTVRNILLEL